MHALIGTELSTARADEILERARRRHVRSRRTQTTRYPAPSDRSA